MVTRSGFIATTAAFCGSTLLGEAIGSASVSLESTSRFAPDVVRHDLDVIWSTLLDVGAQPFRTTSRAIVEARYRSTRAEIVSPLTIREAWLAIAEVLGTLNDGHVGLAFPARLDDAPRRFPLRFALARKSDELLVANDHTGTIPPGSRIVAVEGVTARRYIDVALATCGGQTRALHRSRLTTSGAWPAIALFGFRQAYDVHWITYRGTRRRSLVRAMRAPSRTGNALEPYIYGTLVRGTVGYIDYRRCEDLPRFKRFLETTFAQIDRNPIRALIIDIRTNGGGESELNDALWSYVTTKPFKQFGGSIVKASNRIKREYGRDRYVATYGERAWSAPDGVLLTDREASTQNLIVSKPLSSRFHGPVYLLVSTRTFSSAMSCAMAAKDYGLATIVGEETGEPMNTTGEVYTATAPGTGLRAHLTTTYFLAPKSHPDRQGVVPDVVVKAAPDLGAPGHDPVLEKTLRLIADSSSNR